MIYPQKEFEINGRKIILRSAKVEDAETLLYYIKAIASETPFLLREPEEADISLDQEKAFIKNISDSDKDLMLLAFENGKHIGNCSVSQVSPKLRVRHRCTVAIAIYKAYHGMGIGTKMLQEALDVAKELGYEQAELEVVSENERAVRLYKKLGFKQYGTLPDNMKYKNGSYADCIWMMKKLWYNKKEQR